MNTEVTHSHSHSHSMSQSQRDAEILFKTLKMLSDAKAAGCIRQVWEALDEVAMHATHCETPAVRLRFAKTLTSHKAAYRTDGCTSDEFACLDAFWDLPRRA